MSVTINAKGTTVPHFSIGKGGVTLYPSITDPSLTYTVRDGDYWLNTSDNSLNVWSVVASGWVAPKLADFDFSNSTITSSSSDITLNPGTDKGVIIKGSVGFGHALITTDNYQDLYINPAVGGGGKLLLGPTAWPLSDGTANQALLTNGNGQLRFATIPGNTFVPNEWIASTVTTENSLTSTFFVRGDSPQTSDEITLPTDSANTVKVTVQGMASDYSNICSVSSVVVCHQIGTNSPVVDSSSQTVHSGNGLFTLSYTGVTISNVPYLRITVTATGSAATKTMTWSATSTVSSTAVR
jgi:hypothetical protein